MNHEWKSDFQMSFYNFDTEEYEINVNPFESVETALAYLPYEPTPVARELFKLLVNHKGMPLEAAFLDVLERMVKKGEG